VSRPPRVRRGAGGLFATLRGAPSSLCRPAQVPHRASPAALSRRHVPSTHAAPMGNRRLRTAAACRACRAADRRPREPHRRGQRVPVPRSQSAEPRRRWQTACIPWAGPGWDVPRPRTAPPPRRSQREPWSHPSRAPRGAPMHAGSQHGLRGCIRWSAVGKCGSIHSQSLARGDAHSPKAPDPITVAN
jgi:hypothetical protein